MSINTHTIFKVNCDQTISLYPDFIVLPWYHYQLHWVFYKQTSTDFSELVFHSSSSLSLLQTNL